MKKAYLLLIIPLLLTGCNYPPLRADEIPDKVEKYLNTLYDFEDDECLLLISSKVDYKYTASFFTNKGIGKYWLYENSDTEKFIKYASWDEVKSISYSYGDGWFKAAAITIVLRDESKIYAKFSTDTAQTNLLYKEVKGLWKQYKEEVSEEMVTRESK